ncbi:HNH endonuclease [Herpetosiphon sp.]|uniref:HNH endonuclease n=1 Tax=Herpetosiphon aurantiacus (strain ATCC 23779 / DSM 785 / 114-95) TaxID=316274 RepID=A9AZQ2_HERA2|nr:HNH endonuclease [Herpetosiphon sp.]ABX07106.1 HNH endonuclease [Herpetosiphon aurantiacus DSM 785]
MTILQKVDQATIYVYVTDTKIMRPINQGYQKLIVHYVYTTKVRNYLVIAYKEKGYKKERFIDDNSTAVIVKDWDTPDLPDNLKIIQSDEITSTYEMRYGFNSNEWIEEFNSIIDPWIQSNPERLILDLRKQSIQNVSTVEEDWSAAIQANLFDLPSTQPHQPIASPEIFIEGAEYQSLVTRYERNPEARQRCIEHYGSTCVICHFDFAKVYGELAKGFIHVHHLKPLATIGENYEVNPIDDLRPVCPNCHAVIHMRKEPYTIDEVRNMLQH